MTIRLVSRTNRLYRCLNSQPSFSPFSTFLTGFSKHETFRLSVYLPFSIQPEHSCSPPPLSSNSVPSDLSLRAVAGTENFGWKISAKGTRIRALGGRIESRGILPGNQGLYFGSAEIRRARDVRYLVENSSAPIFIHKAAPGTRSLFLSARFL